MITFNFAPFPILTFDRLLFRRLTDEDAQEVLELRSNAKTMKFIPRPVISTIKEALLHIKLINDNIDTNTDINWAVTEKGLDKCIGIMGFFNTKPENHRTELGYMILPEYHNLGYVTEAVVALLNFAFKEINLHSVQAIIDPENLASERVLQKNGFVKEAHFVENVFYKGKFVDKVIYSLLDRNFKNL